MILILLFCFFLNDFTIAFASYDESDMLSICRNAALQEGISLDDLTNYRTEIKQYDSVTNGIMTTKWLVSFAESDTDESGFVFVIVFVPSGMIQTSNKSRVVFEIERQRLELEQEYGLWYFWDVEKKAQFNEEILTPLGYPSSATVPTEKDITQSQAIQIACSHIQKEIDSMNKQVNPLVLDVNFHDYLEETRWLINFWEVAQMNEPPFVLLFSVAIHSETGEVTDCIKY